MNHPKKAGETGGIRAVREIFEIAGMSPARFIIPAVLAGIASLFELATLALLIPLAKAFIEGGLDPAAEGGAARFLERAGIHLPDGQNGFAVIVLLLLAAAVLKNVFQYFSLVSSSYSIGLLTDGLRRRIFSRMLQFGKSYFDRTSAGALQETILGFTGLISQKLEVVKSFFVVFFLLAAYAAVLIHISWRLALITAAVFPVLDFLLKQIIKKIQKNSHEYARSKEEFGRKISNVLSSIELVKLYSQEEEESRKFSEFSGRFRKIQFSIEQKLNSVSPVQEVFMLVFIVGLVFVMGSMGRTGSGETAAEYLVYFYVLRRMAVAVSLLNKIRSVAASLSGPIEKVKGFFKARDERIASGGGLDFPGAFREIRIEGLSFSYTGETQVLAGVSLSLKQGTVTALAGPTGAGKTTLVNLLMRLYEPPAGTVFADGEDIRNFRLKSWLANFAVVSQSPQLFHDTLRANLVYGLETEPAEPELLRVLSKARLEEFTAALPAGLETPIGDRGVQLSGGERQRLSIARAMLKNAPILILDEATNSIDAETERLIQNAIEELLKGKTAVVIAHRLNTIRRADKIIVLEKGRVAEEGSFETLTAGSGLFSELWRTQNFI